jgi:YgiT-type zinc finger domain-containing protein
MSDQENETTETYNVCPECKTGFMHLEYITYFTWLEQELITVPNFPAWVCDMCGLREYDTRAVNWLNTLLNPATGKKRIYHRKPGSAPIDRPQP